MSASRIRRITVAALLTACATTIAFADAPPAAQINPRQDKLRDMGEAVGARADLAILTSDNPREDDPAQLAATLIDDPIAAPLLWLADRTDEQTTVFRAQEDIASDACGVPRIDHST